MNESVVEALGRLARDGDRLRTELGFDWPRRTGHAVGRVLLDSEQRALPAFAAIMGGASAGKSTVFDNLLERHRVSRITAHGHTTLGPILAGHEKHAPLVERLTGAGWFLPELHPAYAELDDNVTGSPDSLAVVTHGIEALADVLLFDLPDFTSVGAGTEGDLAMALMPWFDRVVIVIDHERWFDRQTTSRFRPESVRVGQERWVLFNRTREGEMGQRDRAALAERALQLTAEGVDVLDHRRGRGLSLFPPGTFDDLIHFLQKPPQLRAAPLTQLVAESVRRVLNQNAERSARLTELADSLEAALLRTTPNVRDCLAAMMTPRERRRLAVIARVLRLQETGDWLSAQMERMTRAVRQWPMVRTLVRATPTGDTGSASTQDRTALAVRHFESVARRQRVEVQGVVRASAFWDEVTRWSGKVPTATDRATDNDVSDADRDAVRRTAIALDEALTTWNAKVESECKGVSPHLTGALGAGTIALAVVLIAAPGPVAALTLVSAKTAIGAALSQLATATGVGALFGRPLNRLVAVTQEKLLGSKEFQAVLDAAERYHSLVLACGRACVHEALSEARSLVLGDHDPLARSLKTVRMLAED